MGIVWVTPKEDPSITVRTEERCIEQHKAWFAKGGKLADYPNCKYPPI